MILGSTILIIGGDPPTRNRHAMELGTHGYDVECADSTETALQTYAADPPALVLFAVDERDGQAWDVYRTIASYYPGQRKGFVLNGSQRLCSVSFGRYELIKAQGPDDLIAIVEELIGTPGLKPYPRRKPLRRFAKRNGRNGRKR